MATQSWSVRPYMVAPAIAGTTFATATFSSVTINYPLDHKDPNASQTSSLKIGLQRPSCCRTTAAGLTRDAQRDRQTPHKTFRFDTANLDWQQAHCGRISSTSSELTATPPKIRELALPFRNASDATSEPARTL